MRLQVHYGVPSDPLHLISTLAGLLVLIAAGVHMTNFLVLCPLRETDSVYPVPTGIPGSIFPVPAAVAATCGYDSFFGAATKNTAFWVTLLGGLAGYLFFFASAAGTQFFAGTRMHRQHPNRWPFVAMVLVPELIALAYLSFSSVVHLSDLNLAGGTDAFPTGMLLYGAHRATVHRWVGTISMWTMWAGAVVGVLMDILRWFTDDAHEPAEPDKRRDPHANTGGFTLVAVVLMVAFNLLLLAYSVNLLTSCPTRTTTSGYALLSGWSYTNLVIGLLQTFPAVMFLLAFWFSGSDRRPGNPGPAQVTGILTAVYVVVFLAYSAGIAWTWVRGGGSSLELYDRLPCGGDFRGTTWIVHALGTFALTLGMALVGFAVATHGNELPGTAAPLPAAYTTNGAADKQLGASRSVAGRSTHRAQLASGNALPTALDPNAGLHERTLLPGRVSDIMSTHQQSNGEVGKFV